jgi:hypothetical protein
LPKRTEENHKHFWHWNRFFSEVFGIALSISFHRGSPYSCIVQGMKNRTAGGRSSETLPHPIDMSRIAGFRAET